MLPSDKINKLFFRCLLISAAIHLLAVIFSEGYHRPDEHTIFIRMAAYKAGLLAESALSQYEWPWNIRPFFQPWLYYLVISFCKTIGVDNFHIVMLIIRFISAAFSFAMQFLFLWQVLPVFSSERWQRLCIYLTSFLWVYPFFHVRQSNENLGSAFLVLALIYFFKVIPLAKLQGKQRLENLSLKILPSLTVGLLFGLAYVVRFQLGFCILFAMLWLLFIKRFPLTYWLVICTGVGMSIVFNLLLDYWGYGEWTFTSWNYFKYGLIDKIPEAMSSAPWWSYPLYILKRGVIPLSLIFILPPIWFFAKKPWHILTWLCLPLFLLHSWAAHKETRYLFPLLPFVPFWASMFCQEFFKESFWQHKFTNWGKKVFVAINGFCLLFAACKPAHSLMGMYKEVYSWQEPPKIINLVRDSLTVGHEGWFKEELTLYLPSITDIAEITKENAKALVERPGVVTWLLINSRSHRELLKTQYANKCSGVYSQYPSWLYQFNIFNWADRSKIWELYKCRTP